MYIAPLYLRHAVSVILKTFLLVAAWGMTVSSFATPAKGPQSLAAVPPMGWNDWAHYQCSYNAKTIIDNANALVKTGLAGRGYNTVTIDDCWMQKDRDAEGDLKEDPQRFPQGIKPVVQAVHALGLKLGIYEDAGYETCGGFAGSGTSNGGGGDHFLQDAKLYVSLGVDYLKLDGCNVYIPKGRNLNAAYRQAYATQSTVLKTVGRPIVFSESAPAYFWGTPDWYDVLSWVRNYGQLWREASDITTFDSKKPNTSRFDSVLWNYAYNLPLGRFQKPGNWNDPDFIIGGDGGMSLAETRSQLALWSMMSAPLILSSDLDKLSTQAIAILSNKSVISIDQDALGRMATLVRRNIAMDLLFKPLSSGDYAIAVLNHSPAPLRVALRPADFGFAANAECRLDAWNLWDKKHQSPTSTLKAKVAAHDTAIWKVHPALSCGLPARTGTIVITAPARHHDIESYSRCLTALGLVGACTGNSTETWIVTATGALKSAGHCLAVANGKPAMQACGAGNAQHWKYTLAGNLISANDDKCLTVSGSDSKPQSLSMQVCGHNLQSQIWSVPN